MKPTVLILAAACLALVVPSTAMGATVKVRDTRYGPILVDGRGHALYLFNRERTTQSRCYGACARAWPPFTTRQTPKAGRGSRRGLLGTTRRRGGAKQVTYNGHPLYFYVDDRKPGQVLCHDVFEFGGRWLVLTRRGNPVS
jgi:predicted lipoprotein with Yx(FWY)xxD motif